MNASKPDFSTLLQRLDETFESGRTRPAAWRSEQLRALETMLERHEERLVAALGDDLGKSPAESWMTELSFVAAAARDARRRLRRWMRDERVPTPLFVQPGRSLIRKEPLGTVLIISPWNYPLQLCLAPLVTAISAGNCAVIKPSELAPATSAALAELLPRHLDSDAFAVVEGDAGESAALLELPFDHIVYTGGDRVARIVMQAAARHLTPVTLELGGKSPCLVLDDADIGISARRIAWGKFINAGQTCIAPDYVLCTPATRARLVPELGEAIHAMFGSRPEESPDYGRIVNDRHYRRLMGLMQGAKAEIGGHGNEPERYIAPTVLTGLTADAPAMQEEIFGPILPIIEVEDPQSAIRFVRARPKPLAAYVFGRDAAAKQRAIDEISAGSVCINDVLMFMAVEQLPFGGVGASGHGTYKGEEGFNRLSHRKAVLKRAWRPDWKLRYPPLTRTGLRIMKALR